MTVTIKALSIMLGAVTAPLFAADGTDAATDTAQLVERLKGLGLVVDSATPSKAPGLLEVQLDGEYVYVTRDGRYLVAGDLYEIRDDKIVGITAEARNAKRQDVLAGMDVEDMLVFTPADGTKAAVLVFTDTDCGYCRKMHAEMPGYHSHGIEVRYLAYPRAGVGSDTYDKMVSAWCADDPQRALTALKRGEGVPPKTCAHPVAQQYQVGQQLGITGTPTIVLPDNTMVPGYAPPDRLAEMLGI